MDLDGVLKKLTEMGYGEIEGPTTPFPTMFFNRTPAEFRRLLDEHGLRCRSAWMSPSSSEPEWEKQVEDARQIGLQYLVVDREPDSLDEYKRVAESWNKLGELCRQAELQLAVHNHFRVFKSFNGARGFDVLLKETDPKLVTFELDCFWVVFAGQDPVKLFKRYPGRFSLLHIKDMKPGYKHSVDTVVGQPFTEVGRGIIDWKRIFAAAPQGGVKHYFVEQDLCDRPPIESARISCEYLKSLTA